MESAEEHRELARCASHPDVAANATCLRCGSFMCRDCADPEVAGHCVACARRLGEGRLVRQVPALAIAMIVNGALTTAMGLYYMLFGGFFVHDLVRAQQTASAEDDGILSGIIFGAVGLIAFVHLVPGVLQAWAGWRLRTFRSRGLGLAALGCGLIATLGCYCAPTSIGLLVWGVIVLMNEDVVARFAATRASDT